MASCLVLAREMRQGPTRATRFEKTLRETVPFDPERQEAVIRASICTGERVAGFKDKSDGHFTEVMLIRSPQEEQRFKEVYQLETVTVEY